jgi:hypothetical protein
VDRIKQATFISSETLSDEMLAGITGKKNKYQIFLTPCQAPNFYGGSGETYQ